MKKALVLILSFSILLAASAMAFASLKDTNPKTVSSYLTDIGLGTGGWKNYYDTEYGCTSPYKSFGSGVLQNNLAYYGEGTANKALRLKLVLNVNEKSEAKAAQQELLTAATALVKKALGASLPQSVAQAIGKGTKASTKLGNTLLEVAREDWPTGKGYSLKFLLK